MDFINFSRMTLDDFTDKDRALDSERNYNNSETKPTDHKDNGVVNCRKRAEYLEWADYFMATALLAAKRSKDPVTQVGACIVSSDNVVVGIGYNGMPTGCHDDEFPWGKNNPSPLDNKHTYVCHAEMNAILNKNAINVKGCSIYVTLFPCNECAKMIIQSGITHVLYLSDKRANKTDTQAAKRMFDAVRIQYTRFTPRHNKIVIDFSEIDRNQAPPKTDAATLNNKC